MNSTISFPPRLSPGAPYIIVLSSLGGGIHIWRVDVDGNNLRQLTKDPKEVFASNNPPDCSPDGKWVVYSKFQQGIWKVSMEGGEPTRISDAPALTPVVSPDGKYIAYSYQDARGTQGVAIMPFEGGSPVKRFDLDTVHIRWMPDGRSLLFIKYEGGVGNVWSQPVAGGKPTQLSHFASDVMPSFDVSPDGKRLIMTRGRITSDVVLIRDLK